MYEKLSLVTFAKYAIKIKPLQKYRLCHIRSSAHTDIEATFYLLKITKLPNSPIVLFKLLLFVNKLVK